MLGGNPFIIRINTNPIITKGFIFAKQQFVVYAYHIIAQTIIFVFKI